MATGYDVRPGGVDSFVEQGAQPIQVNTGASAASARAQTVGGESISGSVGGHYTEAGPIADTLGAYLDKYMEPAIKRKQQAQFFKGYTEAQSGTALNDITHNDSPLSKIFGPSNFEAGAQFYTSHAKIAEWGAKTLAEKDNLKKLPPAELAKYMADGMDGMMTGDPYADQQIQQGLLEAQGPMIQSIATERYKWGQEQAVNAQGEAIHGTSTNLQAIAAANATNGGTGDNAAVASAARASAALFVKPDGMDEGSHQKMVFNAMLRNYRDGNFYANLAVKQLGYDGVLTDAQQTTLTTAADTSGHKAQDEFANRPEVQKKFLLLAAQIERNKMNSGGDDASTQRSVADMMSTVDDLNDEISKGTGVDQPYFDQKAKTEIAKGMFAGFVSRYNSNVSRNQAIEDRNYVAGAAARDRAAEAAAGLATVNTAFSTGQVTEAIAADPALATQFNTAALNRFSTGDYASLAAPYTSGNWTSSAVKDKLTSLTQAGIGEKYTVATKNAYGIWQAFNKINPALASAYFGDHSMEFTQFDQMVKGGASEEFAYRRAFFKSGGYGISTVPQGKRKEYEAALAPILAAGQHSWVNPFKWGNDTLNPAGNAELTAAIGDRFAALSEYDHRPADQLAQQASHEVFGNGRFEQYGVLGILNTRPGKTLARTLQLQPKEARDVVQGAVSEALARSGVTSLDGVSVMRVGNDLTIENLVDGVTTYQHVTYQQLNDYADRYKRGQITAATAQTLPNFSPARERNSGGTGDNRRVAGETTAQRVMRLNKEASAKFAKPGKPNDLFDNIAAVGGEVARQAGLAGDAIVSARDTVRNNIRRKP